LQIPQGLLVRPHQEHAEDVLLPGLERMEREGVALAVGVDEGVELAIAIAGEIGDDPLALGAFAVAVDGLPINLFFD
jgi:hypothetical protein